MQENGRTSFLRITLYVVLFIILINLPVLGDIPPVKFVRSTAISITYPFQFVSFKIFDGTRYVVVSIAGLRSAQVENERLRIKLMSEQSIHNVFEGLVKENKNLRAQLGFKRSNPYGLKLVPAEIISRSPSNWFQTVQIDKGVKDGISTGKAVVNTHGLIGRIVEVNTYSSKVLLITDPQSIVSVLFKRTGDIGCSLGDASNNLRVKYIHSISDVKIGDETVTSGSSDYYPKGIPVGTVVDVGKKDFDLFQQITLKTSVDFSKIDTVFIVR